MFKLDQTRTSVMNQLCLNLFNSWRTIRKRKNLIYFQIWPTGTSTRGTSFTMNLLCWRCYLVLFPSRWNAQTIDWWCVYHQLGHLKARVLPPVCFGSWTSSVKSYGTLTEVSCRIVKEMCANKLFLNTKVISVLLHAWICISSVSMTVCFIAACLWTYHLLCILQW